MIRKVFITKLKPFAELRRINSVKEHGVFKRFGNSGGGYAAIFIGLGALFVGLMIFINITDYALFTYKRNVISNAMDYAITAAVHQINTGQSRGGIASGFDVDTGRSQVKDIQIDMDTAISIFKSIFYKNCPVNNISVEQNLLVCATSLNKEEKIEYIINAGNKLVLKGELDEPLMINEKINQAISQYWSKSLDKSQVYINGNNKTNMLEKGTYLFAFIHEADISGIVTKRRISLSSFSGAKLDR